MLSTLDSQLSTFKVGIIGPESTGKTTLARYLAKRYDGVYVPEYAREYVERQGTTDISYDQLCDIARHQIEELKKLSASLYFFDTELIVTKVWFDWVWHQVPQWLDEALNTYKMDTYLLVYPDIPWVPDPPARTNGSDQVRLALFERYQQEIQALDVPYYIIKHN